MYFNKPAPGVQKVTFEHILDLQMEYMDYMHKGNFQCICKLARGLMCSEHNMISLSCKQYKAFLTNLPSMILFSMGWSGDTEDYTT